MTATATVNAMATNNRVRRYPSCEGGDAGSSECAETCPGCLIDGACIGADTIDPGNACRVRDRAETGGVVE